MKLLLLVSTLALPALIFGRGLGHFETIQLKRDHLPSRLVKRGDTTIPLLPNAFARTITMEVSVGSNSNSTMGTTGAQSIRVIVDTGSSELWFPISNTQGCTEHPTLCELFGTYQSSLSATFRFKNDFFQISYLDGTSSSGIYFTDRFSLGGFTLANQTMGEANDTTILPGIIGFGYPPPDTPDNQARGLVYPRFLQQLVSQGSINAAAFSININNIDASQGTLLIGAIDTTQYVGPLHAVPIQKSSDGTFDSYNVLLSAFVIADQNGNEQVFNANNALGHIDSGSEDGELPLDVFTALVAVTNAVPHPDLGLYLVDCSLQSCKNLKILISFGSLTNFTVEAANMISPAFDSSGNRIMNPDGSQACTIPFSQPSDPGGPLFIGQGLLRPAYIVFDQSNNQIAFSQSIIAQTSHAKRQNSGIIVIPSGGVLTIPGGVAIYDPSAQDGSAVIPTVAPTASVTVLPLSSTASAVTSAQTSVATSTSRSTDSSGQIFNVLYSNTIIINDPILQPVVVTGANGQLTTTYSSLPQIQTIGSTVVRTEPCHCQAVATPANGIVINALNGQGAQPQAAAQAQATAGASANSNNSGQGSSSAAASSGSSNSLASSSGNGAAQANAGTGSVAAAVANSNSIANANVNTNSNVKSNTTASTIFKGEGKRASLSNYVGPVVFVSLGLLL
ncbi:putative aspartic-type endopeptidase opsB [Neolecta irregularis DAH-3]|uniref:Putative aspartic-type endopeptidase opsB n=1 Tax=Neolecta irregularis (strain DAH-3) TaxID=1198029 RepID=A0A1U7LWE1_NEOID|nr:putative aspartic-type endopeptidase opsB [Neolecta irregularis DAH-3]|eukprot:OLL26938.1 putative aspartic-type endopeptidase opsB [Neolecta irregularis DAH-3]